MDLGLGRFLEMFEERFGKIPTQIMMILIALGISSLMIGWIWSNVLGPLYKFAAETVPTLSFSFVTLEEVSRNISVTVFFILAVSLLFLRVRRGEQNRQTVALLELVEEVAKKIIAKEEKEEENKIKMEEFRQELLRKASEERARIGAPSLERAAYEAWRKGQKN